MNPEVSFVVPCYKLAHLLSDCVNSILAQSFENFEILVMDDCSPDNTREIAQSFSDSRVVYICNKANLGHLRNYNEGIRLSKGKYIWLISADDCLRNPDVLVNYIRVMEDNQKIGYSFCPAIRLEGGQEKGLLQYSSHGSKDAVWNGREFLCQLIMENTIVAPSAMARKECYEKISMFPLDRPWGGDWFLWCVFALHYDVAYFAEPMVCYRQHSQSMTNTLMFGGHMYSCLDEDIELPWTIKKMAKESGYHNVMKACRTAIAREYARSIATHRYLQGDAHISVQNVEESLHKYAENLEEESWIKARMYAQMGTFYHWQKEYENARMSYALALKEDVRMAKVWLQYLLLSMGSVGIHIRESLGELRSRMARSK